MASDARVMVVIPALTCDNKGAAPECVNTRRPLTRSTSTHPKEGLAMQATRNPICAIDGCEKPRARRDWCSMHHSRWLRHGSTDTPPSRRRKVCLITGCGLIADTRGWCKKHYTRWLRHGSPEPLTIIPNLDGETVAERLLLNLALSRSGCWLWTGAEVEGYGQMRIQNKAIRVHRLAHEEWIGPIPEGMEVDHLCSVHACFNPAHLEAVPPAINRHRAHVRDGLRCQCPPDVQEAS